MARLMENDILAGNIRTIPPEGSLLPGTYHFAQGSTREQVIQSMQEAQHQFVSEVWELRTPNLPFLKPEHLTILASIVERETRKPEEYTRVAAVFINRLLQKMKLQSDQTVIYGLVGGQGTLSRPILRSELTQQTPYNTYLIDGLPPGPIANPGRAAIQAAANPARTRELFLVADGTGGHLFAETLVQHQKNLAGVR